MSDDHQPAETLEIDMNGKPLSAVLMEVERQYLSYVMTETGGNKTHAARRAGMSLQTFRRKLRGYTIKTVFSLE